MSNEVFEAAAAYDKIGMLKEEVDAHKSILHAMRMRLEELERERAARDAANSMVNHLKNLIDETPAERQASPVDERRSETYPNRGQEAKPQFVWKERSGLAPHHQRREVVIDGTRYIEAAT